MTTSRCARTVEGIYCFRPKNNLNPSNCPHNRSTPHHHPSNKKQNQHVEQPNERNRSQKNPLLLGPNLNLFLWFRNGLRHYYHSPFEIVLTSPSALRNARRWIINCRVQCEVGVTRSILTTQNRSSNRPALRGRKAGTQIVSILLCRALHRADGVVGVGTLVCRIPHKKRRSTLSGDSPGQDLAVPWRQQPGP